MCTQSTTRKCIARHVLSPIRIPGYGRVLGIYFEKNLFPLWPEVCAFVEKLEKHRKMLIMVCINSSNQLIRCCFSSFCGVLWGI